MITVQQAFEAESFQVSINDNSQSSFTKHYIAEGSDTESDIVNAVLDEAPETYNDLPRQSVAIAERLTEMIWKVDVEYSDDSSSPSDQEEEDSYQFDISAGTKRIVHPIRHKATYPNSVDYPSAGINNGEGIDIIMPVPKFSETHKISPGRCSTSYRRKVAELVAKTNDKTFKGYNAGEVLFAGASGSRSGKEDWTVTFEFLLSFAQENITIGDITGIRKDPWDVIWCDYTERIYDDGERYKRVNAVHVDQVYEEGNFNALGI